MINISIFAVLIVCSVGLILFSLVDFFLVRTLPARRFRNIFGNYPNKTEQKQIQTVLRGKRERLLRCQVEFESFLVRIRGRELESIECTILGGHVRALVDAWASYERAVKSAALWGRIQKNSRWFAPLKGKPSLEGVL